MQNITLGSSQIYLTENFWKWMWHHKIVTQCRLAFWSHLVYYPGVLKFGFDRDVTPWNLKVDPYKYQFFKKKWPIYIPIRPNFEQNHLIFPKFWLKFGKILKINPFTYQIMLFMRGHSYTKRLILPPMLAKYPFPGWPRTASWIFWH